MAARVGGLRENLVSARPTGIRTAVLRDSSHDARARRV